MKDSCCPECGHMIESRGRFCMFCGCDLRKTPAVAAKEKPAESGTKKPADAQTADGSVPYDSARKTLLAAIIAVFVAAFVIIAAVFGFVTAGKKKTESFLSAGRSFSSICSSLEKDGFRKKGDETRKDGKVSQAFEGGRVYGYQPYYSVLTEEADGFTLTYFFVKENMPAGADHAFSGMLGEMKEEYGDPSYVSSDKTYYSWKEGERGIVLMKTGDMVTIMESIPKEQ